MTIPFHAVVRPDSVVFTTPEGLTHSIGQSHPNFGRVKDQIKLIREARDAGRDITTFVDALVRMTDVSGEINKVGVGLVTVSDGVVYYNGKPVHGAVVDHILWGLREGEDITAHIAFLNNMMQNPSNRAVEQLYQFIMKHGMALSEDGHIIAYKRVRSNLTDIHSGTIDNSPGQIVTMERNAVNDNPNETCSHGLHFCAQKYLPQFGSSRNKHLDRIVIVKVNPRDVVSIPTDYDHAKARCCRYEVLGEYGGTDKEDLLSNRPVWREDTIRDGSAWHRPACDDGDQESDQQDDLHEEEEEEEDGEVDIDLTDTRDGSEATGTALLVLEKIVLTRTEGEVLVTFDGFSADWGEEGEVEVAVAAATVDMKRLNMKVGVVATGQHDGIDVALIEFPADSDEHRLWVPTYSLIEFLAPATDLANEDAQPEIEDFVSGRVVNVGTRLTALPDSDDLAGDGIEDPSLIGVAHVLDTDQAVVQTVDDGDRKVFFVDVGDLSPERAAEIVDGVRKDIESRRMPEAPVAATPEEVAVETALDEPPAPSPPAPKIGPATRMVFDPKTGSLKPFVG